MEASGEQVGSGVAPKGPPSLGADGLNTAGDGVGGGAVRSIAMI